MGGSLAVNLEAIRNIVMGSGKKVNLLQVFQWGRYNEEK